MDLRQIKCLVALCEEQSVSRAARRLHVVQPAVSMQIRRLETDFGVSLFERTAHGVEPNAIARRLYPICKKVLDDVEAASELLRRSTGRVVGNLAMGVPPSLAQGLLAKVLIDYHERFPDVRLRVHEGYTASLVDWLNQGHIDFAILSSIESDRRLKLQPLAAEELVIVTSRGEAAGKRQLPAAALSRFRLVLPSAHNLTRIIIEGELQRVGLTLEPAMEVDSLATVFNLVRNRGWASILPASALPPLDRSPYRSIRLIEPVITRTLVVALMPQREPPLAAQILIGLIEEALKANAPGAAEAQHQAG